jgi:hypothetical protein
MVIAPTQPREGIMSMIGFVVVIGEAAQLEPGVAE